MFQMKYLQCSKSCLLNEAIISTESRIRIDLVRHWLLFGGLRLPWREFTSFSHSALHGLIVASVLTALLALSACFLALDAFKDDSRVRHTPAVLQWLGTPLKVVRDYAGGLWGKFRRRRERKGAEAKLLVTDPESLEFHDHEMGIRVRPM